MSTDDEKQKIIIIGASLSGLSMALSVVRNLGDQFSVHVIEKRKDAFYRNGSAYGLAPNGQKAMAEISPEVLEHCRSIGMELPTGGFLMPWFEIRNALLRECEKLPSAITVRKGLEVNSVQQKTSSVVVSFKDSELQLEGLLLVGADGVRSTVRGLMGLQPAADVGAYAWRGSIDTLKEGSKLRDMKLKYTIPGMSLNQIGKTLVAFFDFREKLPGIVSWVVNTTNPNVTIVPGESTPMDLLDKEPTEETPVDIMEQILQVFQESDREDLERSAPMCVTPLPDPTDKEDTSWCCTGRTVIIGDAAHTIRPASGLGGAMAFEDVAILTRLLKEGLERDEAIPNILEKFARKRLPRMKTISDDQTMRSEASYKKDPIKPWSEKYTEWVFLGPDAPSHPPIEE